MTSVSGWSVLFFFYMRFLFAVILAFLVFVNAEIFFGFVSSVIFKVSFLFLISG